MKPVFHKLNALFAALKNRKQWYYDSLSPLSANLYSMSNNQDLKWNIFKILRNT